MAAVVPAPICGDLEKAGEGVDLLAELAARLKHYAGYVEKAIEGLPLDVDVFAGYAPEAVLLHAPGVGWFHGADVAAIRKRMCELMMGYDMTRSQAMYYAMDEAKLKHRLDYIFDVNPGTPANQLAAARDKVRKA